MNGMNELTEEQCQEFYGCSLKELEEQQTWMNYVMNRVRMKTGHIINEIDVAIVVEEFRKRVEELEEKQND